MDDSLESPTTAPPPEASQDGREEEEESGDEDQGPDWTKMPGLAAARPVIPKRGEKDFEPTAQGGSGLQRHVLDRSRAAMLEALKAPRTISHKSVSHAIWYPQLSRAHVTVAKGIHFSNMGHSVARASEDSQDAKKIQKRLELLPEEALYLVERGAMYCWKPTDLPLHKTPQLDDMQGVPMSVQQAFAEMIGKEDLTLERYQVYAHLRRLGYVVTRTKPPTPDYPVPPPFPHVAQRTTSIFSILHGLFSSLLQRITRIFTSRRDWWRPIQSRRWLHHSMDNKSLFKSLRFLPSGYDVQLHVKPELEASPSPYQIFFNLYKPSSSYKKTAPPLPDYSVVVVNARTTPMPTISELTALFGELPELPPPVPRKRMSFAQQKEAAAAPASQPSEVKPAPPPATQTPPSRSVFSWIWPSSKPAATTKTPQRPPNPFALLKQGKKMVVVAAVDAGTISFFRFGQGVFTEWPMS